MSLIDQIQSGTVAVTDRTRVFGYSAGIPNLAIDGKKSNLKCNPIDGGKLLAYFPGRDGYKGGLNAQGVFTQAYLDIMPSEYAYRVENLFKGYGYRSLPMLTALPYELPPRRPSQPRVVDQITRRQDAFDLNAWNEQVSAYDKTYNDDWYRANDLAYHYFSVVHPDSSTCPFGLNQKTQINDPGGVQGELFYMHCPTCRLAELKSEECSSRIYDASRDLDSNILAQLRTTLIDANQNALTYAESSVAMVMADVSRRMTGSDNGRAGLNTIDRMHLKMQHKDENVGANAQSDMMRTFAQEVGAAIRSNTVQAVAPVVEPNAVTITAEEKAEYDAYLARKAQMANARAAKEKKDDSNTETGQ